MVVHKWLGEKKKQYYDPVKKEIWDQGEATYEVGKSVFGELKEGDLGGAAHETQKGFAEGVVHYLDPAFGSGAFGEGVAAAVAEGDWGRVAKESLLIASLGPYADDFKSWIEEGVLDGNVEYEIRGPNGNGAYMMKVTVPDDEIYIGFEDEASLTRGMNVLLAAGGQPLHEVPGDGAVPAPSGNEYTDDAVIPNGTEPPITYNEYPPVEDVKGGERMGFDEWQSTIGKGGSELDYTDWLAGY